jgi:hypothetical protein
MSKSINHPSPNKKLKPLSNDGCPTHATPQLLNKEQNVNAISVPFARGIGLPGHLALATPAATYLKISGNVAFDAPAHHGAQPVHKAGATAAQITKTNRQYRSSLKEVGIYTAVEATLKQLLLMAVPDTYLDELNDVNFGYATPLFSYP